ncbi:MAG: hypothetical protein U0165_15565 [Polyangiaceae bacterium]
MPTFVWLLNFDADAELAQAKGAYSPTDPVRKRSAELVSKLVGLVDTDDVVVGTDVSAPLNLGGLKVPRIDLVARAWSPTPQVIRAFSRAGVAPPASPGVDILRRVNGRSFNATLGSALPGAFFSSNEEEILQAIRQDPVASQAGSWLLKRQHAFAGRGRRSIRPNEISNGDLLWIRASVGEGEGLQIEPRVERMLDVAQHGFIGRSGIVLFGEPTVQRCDETGAWLETRRANDELWSSERDRLASELNRAASALVEAGYFGPFGIDGFRWIDRTSHPQFQPRCEINARYTMGWAIGMGSSRPDRTPGLAPTETIFSRRFFAILERMTTIKLSPHRGCFGVGFWLLLLFR